MCANCSAMLRRRVESVDHRPKSSPWNAINVEKISVRSRRACITQTYQVVARQIFRDILQLEVEHLYKTEFRIWEPGHTECWILACRTPTLDRLQLHASKTYQELIRHRNWILRLYWLCADKEDLYLVTIGFQPFFKQSFVVPYTVSAADTEERSFTPPQISKDRALTVQSSLNKQTPSPLS